MQNKERSRVEDGLKSFELDDIDKICREIEVDEERRQRRKRTFQDSQQTDTQTRQARENREESVKLDMKYPGSRDWVEKSVDIVIEHLNKFGACVIDDFLGPDRGHDILEEVEGLQAAQMFRGGQLVTASATADRYRSDLIAWTDGVSPPGPSIRHLISTLDAIVTTANVRPDRGGLADYDISGRTNAMVACYPGQGAHYVRHVDNPNGDGRCITAIYYLNKDWNPEVRRISYILLCWFISVMAELSRYTQPICQAWSPILIHYLIE